jgi:hypothetical protein
LCRALAASDKRLRAKKIIDWMDAALDHRDARRRMRRLHWLLRRLKWVPVALFANLFLIAPASVALLGYSVWYVPITLHVGLSAVAVITFLRASTKLRLARQDDRFATASMLLLFPPSTARYAELLSRDLLWSLHPIATALATLDRDSVRHLARQELMGWNTGRLEGGERESPCQTVEEWYRETFEARLLTALEGCGLHRQEILQPPSPEPGALTYCPRCHAQYRGGFEKCVDCDGLALLPHGRKIS